MDELALKRLAFAPQFAARLRQSRMQVVITGAGGWLGQAALEMFASAYGEDFPAQVSAFGAQARLQTLRNGARCEVRALAELGRFTRHGALVFHCAFLTREHAAAMALQAYIAANRNITRTVASFLERCGAAGVFLPSSGAAYGPGGIEANPYGVLKREDETLFGAFGRQAGTPAAIMRVFNLAGPFINKLDSYALACIIGDILRRRPVRLRAAHPVWRGYAHVSDVLNLGLGCLLDGAPARVFDSGGEAIEIGDLARRAARLLGVGESDIERPDWRGAAADSYLGNGRIYESLAARHHITLTTLDEQILDTAAFISDALKNAG